MTSYFPHVINCSQNPVYLSKTLNFLYPCCYSFSTHTFSTLITARAYESSSLMCCPAPNSWTSAGQRALSKMHICIYFSRLKTDQRLPTALRKITKLLLMVHKTLWDLPLLTSPASFQLWTLCFSHTEFLLVHQIPHVFCFSPGSFLCIGFSLWPEHVPCPNPTWSACISASDLSSDHFWFHTDDWPQSPQNLVLRLQWQLSHYIVMILPILFDGKFYSSHSWCLYKGKSLVCAQKTIGFLGQIKEFEFHSVRKGDTTAILKGVKWLTQGWWWWCLSDTHNWLQTEEECFPPL